MRAGKGDLNAYAARGAIPAIVVDGSDQHQAGDRHDLQVRRAGVITSMVCGVDWADDRQAAPGEAMAAMVEGLAVEDEADEVEAGRLDDWLSRSPWRLCRRSMATSSYRTCRGSPK